MTDFPFDKQSMREEQSISFIKEKLQVILETLESQKQQFIRHYQKQMMAYQQELRMKDSIIESLVQSIQIKNQKISQMKNQSSNYLALIENLKAQIFKMASVVNNIKKHEPKPQLKRVKSDYIVNPFAKVSIPNQNLASRGKKFDINSYFQNVKLKDPYKKQPISTQRSSQLDDNVSSTDTIKMKPQTYDSQVLRALKNNEDKFKRTLKWIQQKRNKPKELIYTINDYKQNFWQQTY